MLIRLFQDLWVLLNDFAIKNMAKKFGNLVITTISFTEKNDYNKIWEYIDTNVYKWKKDCFYVKEKDDIMLEKDWLFPSDERFKRNIDRHGEGTAQFIGDAIKSYCGNG